MKKTLVIALAALALAACSKNKGGSVKLHNDLDSVAYVIGMNVGMNLMRMDSTLNVEAVCQGIRDHFRGKTRLTADEAETFFLSYVNYALPEKARAYEEQFLEDIRKSNRAYARTTSGVTYTVEDVGDAERTPVNERDSVVFRYLLRTADGEELYSSYERGDTVRTELRDLTEGLSESLKLLGEGGPHQGVDALVGRLRSRGVRLAGREAQPDALLRNRASEGRPLRQSDAPFEFKPLM